MSLPQDMYDAAQSVLQNAYAPYSHYQVAACVRAENNELFYGCNIENASYSLTLCAESGAIGGLIGQGHKKITEVLILINGSQLCPPCGACRQRLVEFASPDTAIHLCTTSGEQKTLTLGELMPFPFNSETMEQA